MHVDGACVTPEQKGGTWPRQGRMSLVGWDEKTWVARRGSPTVVVQREVGDHLAAFQIETAEVGQPSKPQRLSIAPPSCAL